MSNIQRSTEKTETIKILCLCDSPQTEPELNSGFAAVARALFTRWAKLPGVKVEVWAIGFNGHGYAKAPYALYPAGNGGDWQNRLDSFIQKIQGGDYTHVWIMQDLDILCQNDFPNKLKAVCAAKKVRSACYFPMDAPTDPAWMQILAAVDAPIAYTRYGAAEAERNAALAKLRIKCKVVPHGVDTNIFKPMPNAEDGTPCREYLKLGIHTEKSKEVSWVPFLKDGDFCLLDVSTNQWRKDPLRALEILAGLIEEGVPAKLVMHMLEHPQPGSGGINLEMAAAQLGLQLGKDWMHMGPFFRSPGMFGLSSLPESSLNKIYNCADLLVLPSLGEGWGLPITEALAAGLSVALPMHTACLEISEEATRRGMRDKLVPMMTEKGCVMGDSRLRKRVDLTDAIAAIKAHYESGKYKTRNGLTPEMKTWLDWDAIASTMLNIVIGSDTFSKAEDFAPKDTNATAAATE